jgi:hypothetical protein
MWVTSCVQPHSHPGGPRAAHVHRLLAVGGASKLLLYDRAGHNDFVTQFPILTVQPAQPPRAPAASAARQQRAGGAGSGGAAEMEAGMEAGVGAGAACPHAELRVRAVQGLRPYARDLVRILSGAVDVRYNRLAPAAVGGAAAAGGAPAASQAAAQATQPLGWAGTGWDGGWEGRAVAGGLEGLSGLPLPREAGGDSEAWEDGSSGGAAGLLGAWAGQRQRHLPPAGAAVWSRL